MYDLNTVIKTFNRLIKESKDELMVNYYTIIVEYLKLEHKHFDQVQQAGKPIYHYFQYYLPMSGKDYFLFLYNPYNPVRFAVETFDSIESIRQEKISKR